MKVFRGFDNLPSFKGAVATLGSFDGLHRGHLSLLSRVKSLASELNGESVVLTFDPHPRVVLGRAEGLRLLTSTEEKIAILESFGIDNLIIIPFDRDFSRFSYRDFVKLYLIDKIAISTLVIGYNHHVGRGSEGSYEGLLKMSMEFGFDIHMVDELQCCGCDNVSSTVVRRLLASGELESVNNLLSRPYIFIGQVDGDGRVWSSDALKHYPPTGEYRVSIDGCESRVCVDDNGIMWSDDGEQRVVIEFLERLI